MVSLIVAMLPPPSRLMGHEGRLPWYLPEDLQHFKTTTMGHALIMGRRTLDEIKKPLKGRRNMVITRNPTPPTVAGIEWFPTIESAIAAAQAGAPGYPPDSEPMIAGGSEIYRLALDRRLVQRMYITLVHLTPTPIGDTFFPVWKPNDWHEASRRKGAQDPVEFVTYDRN